MDWVDQFAKVSLQYAAVSILLLDEEGIVRFANGQAQAYFHLTAERIQNTHIHDLVHQAKKRHSTHDQASCPLLLKTKTNEPHLRQTEVFWREMTPCWVEYSIYPLSDSRGTKAWLLSFLDAEIAFTGKKDYLRSRAKYRMAFEMGHDAKVIVNRKGIITDANAAALTFFEKDAILTEDFQLLFPREGRAALRALWKSRHKRSIRLAPLEFRRDSDEELFVEITFVPDMLAGETLIIWRDTTARVLEQRQREQFLALVGHELRTPLAVIKAFTQLLLSNTTIQGDKKINRYLTHIHEKTDLLTGLINGMMDAIHLGSGKLEFEDQPVVFDELVSTIIFELRKMYPENPLVLQGTTEITLPLDKHRFTQVLSNLVTNAVKYSPPGSEIVIERAFEQQRVQVSVNDKGKGIPKTEQAKLFLPFFRGKSARNSQAKGLGLGLYLARQLVRHYKGTIEVKSRYGKGSTFSILLPLRSK